MSRGVAHSAVLLTCRLLVAGVFLYASLPKIADPATFARDIANYRLLPALAANMLAVTLPWMELAVALLVATGIWARAAGLLATVMLLAFAGAVAAAVARGLDISCGCFGKTERAGVVGWDLVARNVALAVPAIVVLFWGAGAWSISATVRARIRTRV